MINVRNEKFCIFIISRGNYNNEYYHHYTSLSLVLAHTPPPPLSHFIFPSSLTLSSLSPCFLFYSFLPLRLSFLFPLSFSLSLPLPLSLFVPLSSLSHSLFLYLFLSLVFKKRNHALVAPLPSSSNRGVACDGLVALLGVYIMTQRP